MAMQSWRWRSWERDLAGGGGSERCSTEHPVRTSGSCARRKRLKEAGDAARLACNGGFREEVLLMYFFSRRGSSPLRAGVSVTRDMSGCSTRSVRFVPEGSHAAGGQNGPDHRCDWVASSEEVELRGGGGAVGDERAALSPAARRLRGAGRRGDRGPAARAGVGPAGTGRRGRVGGRAVPPPLLRFHGQALPRGRPGPADGGRPAVWPELYVDQERAAAARLGHQGAEALGASQEAGAPAPARDAVVPGRLATCLAAAGTAARSRGDPG